MIGERALASARNPMFKDFHEFLKTRAIFLDFSANNQQQHLTHNQRQRPTNPLVCRPKRWRM